MSLTSTGATRVVERAHVANSNLALNLGSGAKHIKRAVNVDVIAGTHPDVVHDLNVRPWPFPDNHFAEVLAYDVVEHLNDVVLTFEEIHRVCRPGASVKLALPHFSCANAYTDPTHRHIFGYYTLDNLTADGEFSFYTDVRFQIKHRQIIFLPTLANKIVWRIANRYPRSYEMRWAWIFPAHFLSFELEVIKQRGDLAKPA